MEGAERFLAEFSKLVRLREGGGCCATHLRGQDVWPESACSALVLPTAIPCLLQADEADRQQLRTAALKLRLGQLARERRSREAAEAAAMDERRAQLDRLLAALQGQGAGSPSVQASPVSRSG